MAYVWALTDYERRTGYDYSASRFDLGRVVELLQRLDNPQDKMQLAHVAGTKGKGSTSAMLASILRQTGHCTGLYISPHLHTVRERIQVDGHAISREQFAQAVAAVAEAASGVSGITSFEALTAAAFVAFSQAGVETAVIEVGMGGRLDATNIITPYVVVITSISYDHTGVLGDTLAAIAGEKAGIAKPGVPVISAAQHPEALAALSRRAEVLGCDLEVFGHDWLCQCGQATDRYQEFSLTGKPRQRPLADGIYRIALLGEHQVENAALALAAAERAPLVYGLNHDMLAAGLRQATWPGRFEIVHRQPYVVLDGAHNVDSMTKLRAAMSRHLQFDRLHIVFGASRDKDIAGMIAAITRPKVELYLCQSQHGRAATAGEVAAIAAAIGLPARSFASVEEALWQALEAANPSDCICVTGSLFVVAAAREAIACRWGTVEYRDGEIEVISFGDDWRA